MHLAAAGESAAQLPWLWPDAHSLAALAAPLSADTWSTLRRDPGALLLIQQSRSSQLDPSHCPSFALSRFLEPRILQTVERWYERDRGCWIDWRNPYVLPLYETSLAIAHHAYLLACEIRGGNPRAAWTAAMLAPLGWFAVAAIDPSAVAECQADPQFFDDPDETQLRLWGLDHSAIARRLARCWQLPDWLRKIIGNLDVPVQAVASMGIDGSLFATIQLAIRLAERSGYSLGLVRDANVEELSRGLGIDEPIVRSVEGRFRELDLSEAFDPEWQDPREVLELPETIRATIANRHAEAVPFLVPLERDLDCMHLFLKELRTKEEVRLRDAKLAALAEFAAGASHEINNPLAVISGQSQYLMSRAPDERHRKALESIVRQTQRIHSILAELMQFARPPQMKPQPVFLEQVVKSALDSLQGLAEESGVTLEQLPDALRTWIEADSKHLQTAIGCLVRNAIESASLVKGWVRVGVEAACSSVKIVVDDNGAAPTAAQREHMFDPFYSGRPAGRGRGFGLPTAWRLAREHGGDVHHESSHGGPTRFVLSLPLPDPAAHIAERRSA